MLGLLSSQALGACGSGSACRAATSARTRSRQARTAGAGEVARLAQIDHD